MSETTKELAARLRAIHRASVEAYLGWGFTAEERAQQDKDDAAYFEARAAELALINPDLERELADERIYARQRAQDRCR